MALIDAFKLLYLRRQILLDTTITELKRTYAGSALGLIWLVLGPGFILLVYTIMYTVIFKIRPVDMSTQTYILYVLIGLISFMGFSSALSGTSMSLVSNKQFLLNTVFPAELIPVRSVLISSVIIFFGTPIVLLGAAVYHKVTWAALLIPVVIALQIMFSIGLGWILSLVTLVIRDIQFLLQYITMMLIVITPIGYTPDMVPSSLSLIVYLNPLSYFVRALQVILLYGEIPPLSVFLPAVVISVSSFAIGYWVFQRGKAAFFDYA